jgi:E3 ubiquitin-protein ligase RNF115/126
MADPPPHSVASQGRLDATGDREVVYCHLCGNEWYRENGSLICPSCDGEVSEIVRKELALPLNHANSSQITPESDPRPPTIPDNRPVTPPELQSLRNHNPWQFDDSDPEESDISEHIRRGPGGSIFITQTYRHSARGGDFGSRRRTNPIQRHEPEDVMQDFHGMLSTLLGSGVQAGQTGRSGPGDLFPPSGFSTFRLGGGRGPTITGGRYTFTTPLRPRNTNGPQDVPPVDDLAAYVSTFSY